MAIKTYKKGKPISYRYSKNGDFHALIAGNLSSIAPVGLNPSNTNLQDQLVQINGLSSGIEILGDGAFAGCYKLSSIDLGIALKTISDNGFDGCQQLSTLELPASLENLNSQAIANCTRLNFLTFNYFDSDSEQLTS